jgi:hypothetical protein
VPPLEMCATGRPPGPINVAVSRVVQQQWEAFGPIPGKVGRGPRNRLRGTYRPNIGFGDRSFHLRSLQALHGSAVTCDPLVQSTHSISSRQVHDGYTAAGMYKKDSGDLHGRGSKKSGRRVSCGHLSSSRQSMTSTAIAILCSAAHFTISSGISDHGLEFSSAISMIS